MAGNSKNPETIALHAGYRADKTTGAVAVPIYQTTSFQFPRHGARLQSVRAQGTRQYLYADHEPDLRRAGAARNRPRRRCRRPRRQFGSGRIGHLRAEHCLGRRQYRQRHRPVWRHVEPVQQHLQDHGHRGPFCRSRRSGELPPRHRRQDTRLFTRRRCPIRNSPSSRSRRSPTSAESSACR